MVSPLSFLRNAYCSPGPIVVQAPLSGISKRERSRSYRSESRPHAVVDTTVADAHHLLTSIVRYRSYSTSPSPVKKGMCSRVGIRIFPHVHGWVDFEIYSVYCKRQTNRCSLLYFGGIAKKHPNLAAAKRQTSKLRNQPDINVSN